MKYLLGFFLSLGLLGSMAAVYMQTDSEGNVAYSDVPTSNSQPVNVPSQAEVPKTAPATTPQLPSAATANNPSTPPEIPAAATVPTPEKKPYTTFEILSPKDQETLQNQQPTIPVIVNSIPSLQEGDSIQMFADGQPWGSPSKAFAMDLPKLDRGEHQIYAVILSAQNEILKQTAATTIYLHYASVASPAPPKTGQ